MRFAPILLATLVAALPFAAYAAVPISAIEVSIGPKLQDKAKDYGPRDLDYLKQELRSDLERALAAKGLYGQGGRLELTIVDAKPNRPTFQQMANNPGLSMESVSIGGARIEGVEVAADGQRRPISFDYFETDITQSQYKTTWSDANYAFERFARTYADGKR